MGDSLRAAFDAAQAVADEIGCIVAERDRLLGDREVRNRIESALHASTGDCARCKVCDRQVTAVMEVFRDLMASAAAELLDEKARHQAEQYRLVGQVREERAKHARADETTELERRPA